MRSSTSPTRVLDPTDYAFLAVWLAIGVVLAAPPVLALQDFPNHAQVLRVALAMDDGVPVAGFVRPTGVIFGYRLFYLVSGALARALGEMVALRIFVITTSLCTPLAAAALARRLGADARLTAWLTLPLAFAWPMRMGFMAYGAAFALFLVWCAAMVRITSRWSLLSAVVSAALGYFMHPIPFYFTLLTAGCAAFTIHRETRARIALACSVVAPLAMHAIDAHYGSFSQVEGTERTWIPSALTQRPWPLAAAQVVTRTWGISGPTALGFAAPMLMGLFALVALGVARPSATLPTGVRRFVYVTALGTFAAAICAPHSKDTSWVIGDRVGGYAAVYAAIIAGIALGARPVKRWLVPAAVCCWVAFAAAELWMQGNELARRVKPPEHAPLAGRFLTFRLSEPYAERGSKWWGDSDPFIHVADYALSAHAFTPYLFCYTRYLPVWFDAVEYRAGRRAPPDWHVNQRRKTGSLASCDTFDVRQVELARTYRRYDGVIVTGSVERTTHVREILISRGTEWTSLAPGLTLVPRPQASSQTSSPAPRERAHHADVARR